MKIQNLNINVIENAQDDIVQKLNTALGSGTTKGLPNIVLIEDYRAQSFLQSFPDSFYELTDSFNATDFAEYKIAPTSFDGKNYGVPFDTGVTGLLLGLADCPAAERVGWLLLRCVAASVS